VKVYRETVSRRGWWVAAAVLAASTALGGWAWRSRSVAAVDLDTVWQQAEADFTAGRYDVAEAGLARLARLRRPTPIDRLLMAQVALRRDRPDEALADLNLVPEGHPMAARARLLAGQVELRRRRMRRAEVSLREALRLDPTLVQAHRELIYIYGVLLRRVELNAQFRALSAVAPLTYDNAFHWCLTRNSVWEPKELVELLRPCLDADPDDRGVRLALADSLRQVGKRDEADKALSPLPASDPEARASRVRLALDRGDDLGAESLLKDGPEDNAELARLRGRLALAHRDGPAAVRHFRAAYAAEPDHRDTVFGLGQALAMVGDDAAAAPFVAAARHYDALGTLMQRAATAAGRSDPDLMRALGDACETLRRVPEARAWYALAINANPLDAEAQKALYRLNAAQAKADEKGRG